MPPYGTELNYLYKFTLLQRKMSLDSTLKYETPTSYQEDLVDHDEGSNLKRQHQDTQESEPFQDAGGTLKMESKNKPNALQVGSDHYLFGGSFSESLRTSKLRISLTPEHSYLLPSLPENDRTTGICSRSSIPKNPPRKSTLLHPNFYQSDNLDVDKLEQIQNPIKTKTLGLQLPKPVSAHLSRQSVPVHPELPFSTEQAFKDRVQILKSIDLVSTNSLLLQKQSHTSIKLRVIEHSQSKNLDLEQVNENTKEQIARIEEEVDPKLPAKNNAPKRNCLSVSKIRSLKLHAKRLQNLSKSIEGNACSYSTEEEATFESMDPTILQESETDQTSWQAKEFVISNTTQNFVAKKFNEMTEETDGNSEVHLQNKLHEEEEVLQPKENHQGLNTSASVFEAQVIQCSKEHPANLITDHPKSGHNAPDNNLPIVVLCALSWAKRNENSQYLLSVDVSVANHEKISYIVDSVNPPGNWPEDSIRKFYDSKNGAWLAKDCKHPEPNVKNEKEALLGLAKIFDEIFENFQKCKRILVTILPNHFYYLKNVCSRYGLKSTELFSGWCDLTTLVYDSTSVDHFIIKSSNENQEKLAELYFHVCEKSIEQEFRRSKTMLAILQFLSKNTSIETFAEKHIAEFSLSKEESYLKVFAQVDTIEVDGEAVITSIGFHTPHNCCQWMSPILPKPKHEKHFETLRYFLKGQVSKTSAPIWKYTPQDRNYEMNCLDLQVALKKMMDILTKECEKTKSSGFVFISLTRSNGGMFHLLKALVDCGSNEILKKIKGIGDVESTFESAKHYKLINMKCNSLEEFYKLKTNQKGKTFCPFKDENVRILSHIAAEISSDLKHMDNGKLKFAHLLKSPYTNHLLHSSQANIFLDGFGDVILQQEIQFEKSPNNYHWVDATLIGCLFSKDIEDFELTNHPCTKIRLVTKSVSISKQKNNFRLKVFIPVYLKNLPKGYKIAQAKKTEFLEKAPKTSHLIKDPRLRAQFNTPEKYDKSQTFLKVPVCDRTTEKPQEKTPTSKLEEIHVKDLFENQPKHRNLLIPEDFWNIDFTKIDDNRIKYELEKFDSVFLLPNLKAILIPYIKFFLKRGESVPLEPGESFVLSIASLGIDNIENLISGLKLEDCTYDLSYLKRKISRHFPYLECLLKENIIFFTVLLQDIVKIDWKRKYYDILNAVDSSDNIISLEITTTDILSREKKRKPSKEEEIEESEHNKYKCNQSPIYTDDMHANLKEVKNNLVLPNLDETFSADQTSHRDTIDQYFSKLDKSPAPEQSEYVIQLSEKIVLETELQTSTESSISNCNETQQEIENVTTFVSIETQPKNSLNSEKISKEKLSADSSTENSLKPPVVEHKNMEKEKEANSMKNGQCSIPKSQEISATNENESSGKSGMSGKNSESVQTNNFSKFEKEKDVTSRNSSVKVEAQVVAGPRPKRWPAAAGVKKIERDEFNLTDLVGKSSKTSLMSGTDKNSHSNSQNQQYRKQKKPKLPSELNKIVSTHSTIKFPHPEAPISKNPEKPYRLPITKKAGLCRYFFNASHCRRGKTCFFSHGVGKNIKYCSNFLQHKCKSSKCAKPHLQFEELDKEYKNDMNQACPDCVEGSEAQAVATSTPELSVQRKRPYSGGDPGEDLRKRLRDNRSVVSEDIKENQPDHNAHISLEHDLRNQLQFRNKEFQSRPGHDLRHALESKRSGLDQDLREKLQWQKQESAHHGDEWNREEPQISMHVDQYPPEYIETVTAEQTGGFIERPYNSRYLKRENAFEYNETINWEKEDTLRLSERFLQPENTAYEAEELPLSSMHGKPGKIIIFLVLKLFVIKTLSQN